MAQGVVGNIFFIEQQPASGSLPKPGPAFFSLLQKQKSQKLIYSKSLEIIELSYKIAVLVFV